MITQFHDGDPTEALLTENFPTQNKNDHVNLELLIFRHAHVENSIRLNQLFKRPFFEIFF